MSMVPIAFQGPFEIDALLQAPGPERPVNASTEASSNVLARSCVRGAQTMSILPGGLSRARVAKKGRLGGSR